MNIRLYCDEDSERHALVSALRKRGVDIATALESEMIRKDVRRTVGARCGGAKDDLFVQHGRFLPRTFCLAGGEPLPRGHNPGATAALLGRRSNAGSAQADRYEDSGSDARPT